MARVFIFANSYLARNVVFSLDYLLDLNVDHIILLEENHNKCEKFSINDNVIINYCSTIKDGIINCDLVLILVDDFLPQNAVERVHLKSKELGKRCVNIYSNWNKIQDHTSCFERTNAKDHPTILTLSLGQNAEYYCLEILLNKLFNNKKINIKQYFSDSTRGFFTQFQNHNLLNPSLGLQLNDGAKDYQILVYHVSIGNNTDSLKSCLDACNKLSPDFIIFQSDVQYEKYDELKKIIQYSLLAKVDVHIYTNYFKYDETTKVYCNNVHTDSPDIICIESTDLEDVLTKNILAKIALPENIKTIQ
jgi:hypothetical protein